MNKNEIANDGVSRRSLLQMSGLALLASTVPGIFGGTGAFAQSGGIFKVALPSFDSNWSPLQGGGNNYQMFGFMYATGMYLDADANVHPYVFESWESNADFTVWTFHIDSRAVFSDGTPITAADVKGSYEVAARPATRHQRVEQVSSGIVGYDAVVSGEAAEMPGIVAKDDRTVEITLAGTDPIFFLRVSNSLAPIVKASTMRDENGDELFQWWHPSNNPVVSGPFIPTVMDLDAGRFEMRPNPNFFLDKPLLEGIDMQVVEDPAVAVSLLTKGEYQTAFGLPASATNIKQLGRAYFDGPQGMGGHYFWLSGAKEPTNDLNVRKALIMAVDGAELIRAAFPEGPNLQATQLIHAIKGEDPNYEPYPYDPDAARKALAQSSYGGAATLPRLMMVGISNPTHEIAAQYIAEQWRQVLGIERVDTKPEVDSYSGPDQSNVQIFRDDILPRVPDAVVVLGTAIHSGSGVARDKMGGYKNEEIDRLLDEARLLGIDDPRRIELAQQAQRLFRDDWMAIPFYYYVQARQVTEALDGVQRNLDEQFPEPWKLHFKS